MESYLNPVSEERRIRRKAKRLGYQVVKRRITEHHYIGVVVDDYMLVDIHTKRAVLDGRFDLDMCEIETFLNQMSVKH